MALLTASVENANQTTLRRRYLGHLARGNSLASEIANFSYDVSYQ
jgi:hypothetical protein